MERDCENCYHWNLTDGQLRFGECCAMPPRVFLQHSGDFETQFPITAANEGCSWFREEETKEAPEHETG